MRITPSFLSLALILIAGRLHAAAVESRITAATVYPNRAVVTREAKVDLTAGEQTVVFDHLPSSVDEHFLQVTGQGSTHVTILDVTAKATYITANANPRIQAIQGDIKDLEQHLRIYNDRATVLQQQRELLKRINTAATTPGGATHDDPAPAHVSIEEWQKLMTFSDESLAKILAELQSLDESRANFNDKINALKAQFNKLSAESAPDRSYETVSVRVAAVAAGSVDLALHYTLEQASWTPSYNARFQPESRQIELTYYGVVRQSTGEDWKNIALTLSTARPSLGGGAPELSPWTVDVLTATPYSEKVSRAVSAATSMVAAAPKTAVVELERYITEPSTAHVQSALTSTSFKIPVSATVLSDNTSQKVGISTATLTATLQYEATPQLSETAYLNASAVNSTDYPFLAGSLNAFLGDAFVATSSLRTVMPGEKFDLALGADEGISIKRRMVKHLTESTGFSSKGKRITYEYVITLINNKKTAERLSFKEALPVSRNEKIVVKILAPAERDFLKPELAEATPPAAGIIHGQDGEIIWRLDLAPGEKREVPVKFTIEYPSDLAVTGVE